MSAQHDTNVGRTSDSLAAARGITQEDNVLTPSLNVNLIQPIGRNSVFLNGNVGYRFYEKNDNLNNENADIRGGLNVRVGPCQGVLSGAFTRRERNAEDLGLPDPRIIQDSKTIDFVETCGISDSIGVTFGARQIWNDGKGGVNVLDSESTGMNAGVVFRRSSLGELELSVSHVETEYDGAAPALGSPGYEVNSVSARYSRRIGSRLSGTVTVSQTDVESSSTAPGAQTSDFSGLTYSASLSYRPTQKLSIDLLLDRAVTPAVQLSRLYSIREGLGVNVNYELGTRVSLFAAANRRDVSAGGDILTAGPGLIEATSDEYRAGVRFRQSDRLSFVLDAGHTQYDANDPVLDYSASRVTVSAIVGF